MTGNKDRAMKYGTTVYAALIFLFAVVAYFIYSYFMTQPENVENYVIEMNEDGILEISPGDGSAPNYAPSVPAPTSPPPGN